MSLGVCSQAFSQVCNEGFDPVKASEALRKLETKQQEQLAAAAEDKGVSSGLNTALIEQKGKIQDARNSQDKDKKRQGATRELLMLAALEQFNNRFEGLIAERDALADQYIANKEVLSLAKTGQLDVSNPDHLEKMQLAGLDPEDKLETIIRQAEDQDVALEKRLEAINQEMAQANDQALEQGIIDQERHAENEVIKEAVTMEAIQEATEEFDQQLEALEVDTIENNSAAVNDFNNLFLSS